MNTSSDAAEQVVRMSLNGAEVALKVSGKGAKAVSVLLFKALKSSAQQKRKTKGSLRLNNLVRSGKKLSVVEVSDNSLKDFCSAAKKYGILYTVLKDRNANDGKTEIMYKTEDEEKIRRIFNKIGLFTVDMAEVKENVEKDMAGQPAPERTGRSEKEADDFVDKMMEKANPTKEAGQNENPSQSRAGEPEASVNSSGTKNTVRRDSSDREHPEERRSVREELKKIRAEQTKKTEAQRKRTARDPAGTNEHKAPKKKKNEKER